MIIIQNSIIHLIKIYDQEDELAEATVPTSRKNTQIIEQLK